MKILKKMSKNLALTAMAMVALMSIGGSFALFEFATPIIENRFRNGVVNVTISEEFDEEADIKEEEVTKEVRFKNDSLNGELPVVASYIRAQLVFTWVKDDGSVMPIDAKSLVTIQGMGEHWVVGDDGYFYYTLVVNPDETTEYLMKSVVKNSDAKMPETGHLEINVLVDCLQAEGNAVVEAWKNPTYNGEKIF